MEICTDYLYYDNSYKSSYIKNNSLIKISNPGVEELYQNITTDLDYVLTELCVSPRKNGYRYWKDAVFIFLLNDTAQVKICKEVYPVIAKKYGKSAMSVERAMRVCFEDTMYKVSKKSQSHIIKYMKASLLYPHNSEILCRMTALVSSQNFQKEKQNSPYVAYQM